MKDVLKQTYKLYETKLQELFNQVSDTKKMLNQLAKDLGETAVPYPDATPEGVGAGIAVKPDQFYNKPLATAVRDYLTMRKEAREWPEIVKALREGGYDLAKTRQAEDEARLTILRNTGNFSLIGDNYFGLKEWYGETKKSGKKSVKDTTDKGSEKTKDVVVGPEKS